MKPRELNPPFKIYNASAGAGKTFLLVQTYLEHLLGSSSFHFFHRLLALTFTNKAVFEMKSRILSKLHQFANASSFDNLPMAVNIATKLELTYPEIQRRSERILKTILHDYGAFDVITLDRFTHRVIRTFAQDLGLSYNFQVELNHKQLLSDTVDQLLVQVGHDNELTHLLQRFTFSKMDDEKTTSWDLKNNLIAVAELLLNENDRQNAMLLTQFSPHERKAQSRYLFDEKKDVRARLMTLGEQVMELLQMHELSPEHFSRKILYKKFQGLSQGSFDAFDDGKWHEQLLANQGIYPKKTPSDKQATIDELQPVLAKSFTTAQQLFHRWKLIRSIEKQHLPLQLLTRLAEELEAIQQQTNRVLLATFNSKIHKEILAHPTPYIYERLGENYRHYFIDEFQDTSTLQWKNLIPLISACFLEETDALREGSLLVVGDPKQSIYRWRGGNVDQFIALIEDQNPFTVKQEVTPLKSNYRSFSSIVAFNNRLFSLLPQLLTSSINQSLYGENAQQKIQQQTQGYVHLDFFSCLPKERNEQHIARVVEQIVQLNQENFSLNDMVVLVRTKGEGQCIARALEERNVAFISSESLSLSENPEIAFLINLCHCYVTPHERFPKMEVLDYLYPHLQIQEDRHSFLQTHLDQPWATLLKKFSIDFDLENFGHRSLFETLELAIDAIPGLSAIQPFVAHFLDVVFAFDREENRSPSAFLSFWQQQKDKLTLPMSDEVSGVRIMTIHKAKGLEFPIVFFPFADRLLHANHQEKVWLETQSIFGSNYPLAWLGFSKALEDFGSAGKAVYATKIQQQEIDAWNVFYVAVTRASEQLYLYADQSMIEKPSYAQLFDLLIKEAGLSLDQERYSWGVLPKTQKGIVPEKPKYVPQKSKRNPYEKRLLLQGYASDEKEQNREFGILVHDLLSRIQYADQLESVLIEAKKQGEITAKEHQRLFEVIHSMMEHPQIKPFFTSAYKIWNEHSLVVGGTQILRPDRMVVNDTHVVIIDYKTGKPDSSHANQVETYLEAAQLAFSKPAHGFLVYFPFTNKANIEVIPVSISNTHSSI